MRFHRNAHTEEEKRLVHTVEELTRNYNETKRRAAEEEAALKFMLNLPRFAMAPLWVEVVRLALRHQGEIDALTIHAMQRLSFTLPDLAAPLLGQILVRLQEKDRHVFDREPRSQNATANPTFQAFLQISQAAESADMDLHEKAQKLVNAWDIIMSVKEPVTHD